MTTDLELPKDKRPRLRVLKKTDRKCCYCGRKLGIVGSKAREPMTIEHVKPRSLGGENHRDNLLPACRNCNQLKASFALDEFKRMVFDKWMTRKDRTLWPIPADPSLSKYGDWSYLFTQFNESGGRFWFEVVWARMKGRTP